MIVLHFEQKQFTLVVPAMNVENNASFFWAFAEPVRVEVFDACDFLVSLQDFIEE
jgi:hypothetical protein